MICYNCNNNIPITYTFCPYCGIRTKICVNSNPEIKLYDYATAPLKETSIKNFYEKIITNLPEGIILDRLIYSQDGNVKDYQAVNVNPAYEKITSIKRKDAIQTQASILYKANEPPYLKEFSYTGITGNNHYFESYFPPMDIHFSLSLFCPKIGYFGILFNNINERVGLEEKIINKITELQNTYELMDDVVLIVSKRSGKIITSIGAIEKIFGYSEVEINEKKLKDLQSDDIKDFVYKDYYDTTKKNIPLLTLLKKNGESFYASIIKKDIIHNNLPCYLIFIKDINDKIKRKKRQENFIASLSHDLKVPLLAETITLKYFLKEAYGPLSEGQEAVLNKLLEYNDWLINTVNHLLDLYKNEAVIIEIFLETSNINRLIEKCIKEINASSKYNKIELELNPAIKHSRIDINQVKKIIKYLSSILIKYSTKACKVKSSFSKDNKRIQIDFISDNCIISDNDLIKIIDYLYITPEHIKDFDLRLSLYISSQIVHALKGTIMILKDNNIYSIQVSLPYIKGPDNEM